MDLGDDPREDALALDSLRVVGVENRASSSPGNDVFRSKVAHLLPQTPTAEKDYNEDVRYYTTKPVNGGTTFTCTFCEHSVTTLDFNNKEGNRRTQAAAAINQHAASLHVRPWVPAKLGGRGAL